MFVVNTTSAGVTSNGALVAPRKNVPSSSRRYAGCSARVTRLLRLLGGRGCGGRRRGLLALGLLFQRQRRQRRGRGFLLLLLPDLLLGDGRLGPAPGGDQA